MIELLDVHKRFLENVVLDGVSLEVKDGETVALLGPSGVGKSVTLKMINGLLRPDRGDVIVDGLHVPQLKRQELAQLRAKVGYVFQHGALFDSMSVAENIRLGITDETCYNDEQFCANRILECLRLVNLPPEVATKLPAELSGGMKKRVGIARAIAGQPKYLLSRAWWCRTTCEARSGWRTGWRSCGRRRSAPSARRTRSSRPRIPRCCSSSSAISR